MIIIVESVANITSIMTLILNTSINVSLRVNTFSYITTGQSYQIRKFRIDTYFLTDGPYLNVASAPVLFPPFTQPRFEEPVSGIMSCMELSQIFFSLSDYLFTTLIFFEDGGLYGILSIWGMSDC